MKLKVQSTILKAMGFNMVLTFFNMAGTFFNMAGTYFNMTETIFEIKNTFHNIIGVKNKVSEPINLEIYCFG